MLKFNLWSVDILSIPVEEVSQPDMQFDCLLVCLGFAKLLFIVVYKNWTCSVVCHFNSTEAYSPAAISAH